VVEIDRAARAFGRVAAEYEDGRPGYAADVVALAIAELDLGPGSIVLDLGAGTGKLTASTR
jgi:precorrin-6B methylase 2